MFKAMERMEAEISCMSEADAESICIDDTSVIDCSSMHVEVLHVVCDKPCDAATPVASMAATPVATKQHKTPSMQEKQDDSSAKVVELEEQLAVLQAELFLRAL